MKRRILFSFIALCVISVGFIFSSKLHAEQQTEKTIPLDPTLYPDLVTVDSLHHKAYITAHGDGGLPLPVTILDTMHDTILGILPLNTVRALAINTRINRLYAIDGVTRKLTIFDTATNAQVSTPSALGNDPFLLAVNETTNKLYTISQSAATGGAIMVFDGSTGSQLSKSISFNDIPQAVAVNPLTNKLYVATSGINPQLIVFDGTSSTIMTTVPLANPAADIAIDTVLNKIYISSDTSTDVQVIDGQSNSLLTALSMTNMVPCAHTLTVDSLANKLYAACFNGISIIDTKTNTIVQQIPLIDDLPVSHAITSQYFTMDSLLNKLYVPLEETHEIAVVSLSSPPKLNPLSTRTTNEGSDLAIPISFTDTVGTSWTTQVDFGDFSQDDSETIASPQITVHHIYQAPGSYTFKITVMNNTGALSSETIPIQVHNVSPTVSTISLPQDLILLGSSISASVLFSDPGLEDKHTAFWDWGDGSTSQGTIMQNSVNGTATGTHSYRKSGIYTVSVTITDNYGAATTSTFHYLAVSDSKNSEVVAVGTVQSPPGALQTNRALSGPLSFGVFVSMALPTTGSLEMSFPLGDMQFQATSISISTLHGNSATIQGTGVVNHIGNYGFLLSLSGSTSISQSNMISLKIWDITNNAVLYDSQNLVLNASLIPVQEGVFSFHP